MTIDGKRIAGEVLAEVREGVARFDRALRVGIIAIQPSPATESYLRIKRSKAGQAGIELGIIRLGEQASTEEVVGVVRAFDGNALVVQLPLPSQLDRAAILDAIPRHQDADVLSSDAYADFLAGSPDALMPPVVAAISEVFARTGVDPSGAQAVVIGNGRLVGAPAAAWLAAHDARVTVLEQDSFAARCAELQSADIIVTGAGSPRLITPDLVKEGVVLIDAGTSESNGAIAGDIDPACADKASIFTPVPGGIGPIAVACLFKNVLRLAEKRVFTD